jgi:signal transduction histidine kinase/DNA-binding response OmpR family regulator
MRDPHSLATEFASHVTPKPTRPDAAEPVTKTRRFDGLRGETRLRAVIDDLANQLCVSVDGDFDFSVRAAVEDETLEKLSMLVNFVLDTARRGMSALRQHNETLAQLDQAKTVFFSNASHELRTPLTLMLGPMEDALSRPDKALAGEDLELAHRNALRLHKLVNALLDFSRIEAGRLQGTFAPTDLSAYTRDLANVFRGAIETAGLRLTVDCLPLPEPVYVDREMWERVVLNLLSNAFKATFEGEIAVSLGAGTDSVELAVRDTGTGIPEEELPKLFQRFHRLPSARARSHEGFGIGLALIQELVRLHGGTVRVTSEVGRGSTFVVSLPRGRSHLPAEHIEAAPSPMPAMREVLTPLPEDHGASSSNAMRSAPVPTGPARARILIADDNADMRQYLARVLGAHWQVAIFADGRQALAAALQAPPDLVLTDIMMPEMDGQTLLKALRDESRTRHVPVIFLSARAGAEAVSEGLETGADDYLVKPFAARELIARVRTHLELSRLRMDNTTIQRIGRLLNSQLDLQTIVQTLTDEAVKLCGAQFGAFFYNKVDSKGESYTLYALAGAPRESFAAFPLPRNTALFAPTFAGDGMVRVDDVLRDPRYGKSGPHFGMPRGHLPVRSYLAAPVVSRSGNVLGGLFFGHAQPGVFGERSERLLSALAAQAAIAIDNAQLYEREQAARAQAESASRAKDDFLAMLGHELRNPMAPIVTALEVMEMRPDGARYPERDVIRRQVAHVVRLVDDLLDVSRFTRGKVDLIREIVEIGQVVTKAVEIANPAIEERGHQLVLQIPASGLKVHGDVVRLAQVVSNLLTNAAKFTDRGGRIEIEAAREGASVSLRVRDNGIGMHPDVLPTIFDSFMQAPQSLERSQGGLGLGLAIVRSLVHLHGGTVSAHSPGLGHGAEFVVQLPLAPEGLIRSAGSSGATASPEALTRAAPLRILVVDDNLDASRLLADALSMIGHKTLVVADGQAALSAGMAFEPDVVLLDLGLPEMDGYEVARRMRGLAGGDRMQLVAITGYGLPADRKKTQAAGFDDHLVKPVRIEDVEIRLRRWQSLRT